jgi:hypothetical protein
MSESQHVAALNQKKFVLGVDVGGTSIKTKMYEIVDNKLSDASINLFEQAPTSEKGLDAHVNQMQGIFQDAAVAAKDQDGKLVAIGVGTPGRYKEGVIKPGTSPNFGKAFDGVNLRQKYNKAMAGYLPGGASLEVHNDADMMMAGVLNALRSGEATATDQDGGKVRFDNLKRDQVALFGIGTGIGHSIVRLDRQGNATAVTDGHASKLLLEVDEADKETMKQVETWLKQNRPDIEVPVHYANDGSGRIWAEDLFKDPTFCAIANVQSGKDADMSNKEHRKAAAFIGKYMARTIAAIASGQNEDQAPEQGWSTQDKQDAAKTKTYLISGGLARGEEVMAEIILSAKRELEKIGNANPGLDGKLHEIKIARYIPDSQVEVDDAAERAAAEKALTAHLSKQKSI